MASRKQLEVHTGDQTPHKWCILGEEVFKKFIFHGNPTGHKFFNEGSLFSPLLFRKFFDPSDAFPLWEFESDNLLSNLRSSGRSTVNWFQTDHEYILKAELPGVGNNVQVFVDKGKIVEISGQWRQQGDQSKAKDWRSENWWQYGYVRRLELPEDADWRKIEAYVNNDILLEIRIPMNLLDGDPQGNVAAKDSEVGV
ncbi:21.7 kDa class VI heat shock protein-like [Juglans microcarpa x Juglans regia]|uniref:21.7 kDa class VI heat shock protein-like n=1 Tax=Juglans microcarpa x Juglans regia TaxID=2249226 RepID=UPI001B7F5BD4|nr:21.7 kDa class VI heat shock protein-like [Juglans microcarpa x Juglans regia]